MRHNRRLFESSRGQTGKRPILQFLFYGPHTPSAATTGQSRPIIVFCVDSTRSRQNTDPAPLFRSPWELVFGSGPGL
ncbi:unnamed protein product [Ectocarpus sp. CCAP 1310/34]|nr:unnamed protein product [Ectocarpus sp. CCAP 1310/34]